MVQLKVLSGKMAGTVFAGRRFPWQVGRAPDADFRLEAPGVWERHLVVDVKPDEGFTLAVQPNALATLNGAPFQRAVLRNGDVIEIGSLKLQFELTPPCQLSLRAREWLIWLAVGFAAALQAWLMLNLTD